MGKILASLVLVALLACSDTSNHTDTYGTSDIDKHAINERDPETTNQFEDNPETTNDESNDQ